MFKTNKYLDFYYSFYVGTSAFKQGSSMFERKVQALIEKQNFDHKKQNAGKWKPTGAHSNQES